MEKKEKSCKFIKAWIGECENSVLPGEDYCVDHFEMTCDLKECEKQAHKTCPVTIGLVCGTPLCKEHDHSDHK